jgi:hypothetical protein
MMMYSVPTELLSEFEFHARTRGTGTRVLSLTAWRNMSAFALPPNRSGVRNTISHCRHFRQGSQSSGTSKPHRNFCDNVLSVVEFDDEDSVEAAFYFLTRHDLTSTFAVNYCDIEQSVEVEVKSSGFLALVISI